VFGKKYVIKDTTAEHKLWTLDGNVLTAHKVEIGVTDGTRTEVIGGMKEGSTVIQSFEIGAAAPADKKDATKQDKDKKK
ncbi:MAG: efflux RND transporter periplasmic adaptor subunit, partial [Muribaculaceae bacterium]|nr:efflux RND transporter periplasmic adaptor subunit [Muribaculaceae bacterium]